MFHLILICETFLTDNNCNSCHLTCYNFVGKNRKHSERGCVGIFIRDNITFVERDDLSIFLESNLNQFLLR